MVSTCCLCHKTFSAYGTHWSGQVLSLRHCQNASYLGNPSRWKHLMAIT